MSFSLLKILSRRKETRAITVSLLLIALIAGLGLFSLSRLTMLHDIIMDIQASHVPTLRLLNDVAANSERIRNLQSLTLLTKEPVLKSGVSKRMESVQARRQVAWDRLAKSRLTDSERTIIEPVAQAWDAYLALSAQAMDLQGKGKDDQAISFFNTEAQVAMEQYRGAFYVYLDHVTENIQGTVNRGDALYSESRLVIFYVFLFAVPMCLLAGVSVATLWL